MDNFPTSKDYFSKDNGSQGSSSTVTPRTAAIPRSVTALGNVSISNEGSMEAPLPYNYTYLPSGGTERLFTTASNGDDYLVVPKKTAGPGKRSRFSDFFEASPLGASKNDNSNLMSQRGEELGLGGFRRNYTTPERHIWNMTELASAIQPVNTRLDDPTPFLGRSVWRTSSEEIAGHLRTSSEERQYKNLLAPIGTPPAKLSISKQEQSELPEQTILPEQTTPPEQTTLSEQEIREILSKNWEAPDDKPLTSHEVTWLMRLHAENQPSSPSTALVVAVTAVKDQNSTQQANVHSRNVSADSSRASLSPETSSSLVVAASASPPTSNSTSAARALAQAQAQAQAQKIQSIRFTNTEAQAQQQREIEIAYMKEQRAREAVLRPPPMPMSMAMPVAVPDQAPASMSVLAPTVGAGSRLTASAAAAAPFVPFADTGLRAAMAGLGEGQWAGFLHRQIAHLQGALERI